MQIVNQEKIDKILASKNVKLHLGCGYENWEGYINIDLNSDVSKPDMVADIVDLSFFADETVEEIISYHVIEHLGHRRLIKHFQECYRVLKKGGKLIFETPDLGTVIQKFCDIKFNSGEVKGDLGDDSVYHTIYGGQQDSGSFHISCMTKYQLLVLLKSVGFGEYDIISEIPQKGKEYGSSWNIRFVCTKK